MRSSLSQLGVATIATAAAVGVRALLDPWLGDDLALVTLYGAVAISVWFGGYRCALFAVVTGYLACDYFFIEPRNSFGLDSVRNALGLLTFLLSCAILIGFGEAMHSARRRAEANARELEEREHRIAGLLASITDAFMSFDSQWRFTFINEIGLGLWGKTRDDVIGHNVWDLFPNAGNNESHEPLRRAMRDRVAVEYEVFYKPWQRWFFNRVFPTPDGGLVVYSLDITQRKRTEQDLGVVLADTQLLHRLMMDLAKPGEQQELFDRLMDSAVEIMHSDFASLLVFHNERGATNGSGELRLAASRGFPPEAVAYWERVTADSNCACGIVLRTGERCDVAHLETDPRIKGRDREIYLQAGVRAVQATPLVARDGQLLGAISTHWKTPRNPQKASERDWRMLDVLAQHAADLLERMQVDKVLHDSEQRIRQIVAQLPVGVGVMDSSGHWVLTNPLMEQYVPTAIPSALPERTARWRVWDEQGNSIPPENWPGQRALRGELVTPGLEAHYRTDNGEDVWLRVSAAPLRDENGRIIGATAVALDISKIKRAEQALLENQRTLTELVERSPFGIYIVDADFRIVHVNKSSQEGAFINVRPLIGRSFDDAIRIIWPETVACQVIDQFRHTLETGAPYYSKDFLNPRADTSAVEGYEWELHQIAMPGGRKGVVCYYYDSTRLRSAEQAMREADRRKDEFLATLAHELRNPLAPIRNSLHILRLAGADASTQPQLIEMMERQVDHMVRLVDDLLEVSRITRGKIELRKETIELAAIVRSAVESANPLIESAGHQLEITLPSQPVVLSADPVRMTQALANLLSNAAKYTEAGGRIWLTAGREGDEAVISVRDNGMGIPAEMLPRVFDIFTQIDRALGRSQGGLGIGLALVKNLVQLHDGTVEARSDGQGSEFTIRLPIPAPNESTRSEVKPHFSLQRQATNGRRILIVDDNRDAADSLAMLLRTIGLQTCTAYDGPSALEAVQTYRPSAVFLDIGMPGMDGYAVAAKIRSDPENRNITLVALTGWGQEKDKQHAQEAGFDHHLIKPAEASALQSLLSRINEPAH